MGLVKTTMMENYNKNIVKYKIFEQMDTRITAGIVFIYKNKIMLVHPADRKWDKSFSYPKGKVDGGETIKDAAVRETEEEIGVKFSKRLLSNKNLYRIVNRDEEFGGCIKIDYYYLVKLDDGMYKKYFKQDRVKKKFLPQGELDWGGFISLKHSKDKIKTRLKTVLRHI